MELLGVICAFFFFCFFFGGVWGSLEASSRDFDFAFLAQGLGNGK